MILPALVLAASTMFYPPLPPAATLTPAIVSPAPEQARPFRPSRPAASPIIRAAARVPAPWRAFASCVLARESGGTLDRPQSGVGALNGQGSTAAGRWQMLAGWRSGGPWNVQDRLVRFGMPLRDAREVRRYLHDLWRIDRWPGIYQDVAFLEAIHDGQHGEGRGWLHWSGPGCDRLVP